jgi:cytochrome P450
MAQFHRPVVCITDLSLGSEVLDGQRDRLRAPSQPFGRVSPGAWVAFLDEAGHPRHRPILGPALDAGVVDDARQGVEAVVRGELERMVDASRGLGIPPGPHLDRIVLGALLRIVSGRAPDARRISDLQARFAELGAPGALAPGRPEQNAGPLGPLVAWMQDAGEEVLPRGAPAAASSSVLAAILDDDPGHLADEILLENLVLLVLVTRSNVRGVLGWTLKELADRPARVAEVRGAAPESASGPEGGRRERAARFVSEVLRLHQSEFIYREVERDLAIGDYRVPRGWLLRVCVREAHRDPNVFVDPLEFRPDRFAERRWEDTEYRPFSDGSHSSFGAAAARTIAGVLVEQVAAGFEVRGVADGPVEREGNRHWNHWRPSRSFRVVVGRRDGPGARSPGVDL